MTKLSIASILIAGTIIVSCGSKEEKKVDNTVPSVQPTKIGELKIAFYNQDSLKLNFKYYKEQDAIVTKKQLALQKELESRGLEILSSGFDRIPQVTKELTPEQVADVEKLLEKIEEDDDVMNVFHTMLEN